MIWIEGKKSKQQWQTAVHDIADHDPSGVPAGAVFSCMKQTLESLVPPVDKRKSKGDTGVDLENGDKGVNLFLIVDFNKIWKPEFAFRLVPIALEAIDILTAQLRDAQEEIISLNERNFNISTLCFQVQGRLNTAWNPTEQCPWEAVTSPIANISPIAKTQDREIIINEAGKYLVTVSCFPAFQLWAALQACHNIQVIETGLDRKFVSDFASVLSLPKDAKISLRTPAQLAVNWGDNPNHQCRPLLSIVWLGNI
eukprot:gene8434-17391_t